MDQVLSRHEGMSSVDTWVAESQARERQGVALSDVPPLRNNWEDALETEQSEV